MPKIDENHIAFYNGREVEFIGQIADEPDIGEKYTKLTIGHLTWPVGSMLLHGATMRTRLQSGSKHPSTALGTGELGANINGEGGQVHGKVLVNAYKYGDNNFNYGDWLQIKCRLEAPGVIKSDDNGRDFDYGRYLSVKDIYSVCYWPSWLEVIFTERGETRIDPSASSGQARIYIEKIYTDILQAKQKFKKIIDQNLSLPQSGLLEAMLLGYRRELPQEILDNFSQTGVSHIIAISGLHLTIIAGLLFYLFMALGVARQKAFWPALIILFLYLVMIGFRASAVRAFIMGAVLMYALKIGRLSQGLNSLLLAAVTLLVINPKLLIFDVGFQLSFSAVLGIFYFYPLFERWLSHISLVKRAKNEEKSGQKVNSGVDDKGKIRALISLTLSAQVLTTPLIVYYFGRFSFVSPLTNLLIVPLLPLVLAGGLLVILFGLIWSKLAFVSGLFLWLILSYIIKVTEILSQVPYAYYQFF